MKTKYCLFVFIVGIMLFGYSLKVFALSPTLWESGFIEIVGIYDYYFDQIRGFPYIGDFEKYPILEDKTGKSLKNVRGQIIYAKGEFMDVKEKGPIFSLSGNNMKPTITGYKEVSSKKLKISEWKVIDPIKFIISKEELQYFLLDYPSKISFEFQNPFDKSISISYGLGDHIDKNIIWSKITVNSNEKITTDYTVNKYDKSEYYCENPWATYNLKYTKGSKEETIFFDRGACHERLSQYDIFVQGKTGNYNINIVLPFDLEKLLSEGKLTIGNKTSNNISSDDSKIQTNKEDLLVEGKTYSIKELNSNISKINRRVKVKAYVVDINIPLAGIVQENFIVISDNRAYNPEYPSCAIGTPCLPVTNINEAILYLNKNTSFFEGSGKFEFEVNIKNISNTKIPQNEFRLISVTRENISIDDKRDVAENNQGKRKNIFKRIWFWFIDLF